ncbi:hypothetical protein PRIPAC_83870 [Pristionchus pacificus]|uniref:Uncharacterized protein n=1 Tax=Pristionchus pacificus TaxID=54126 RepID=A0A2A6BGZ0_PRIPA|nr:hypothetical protein PRIPAC_83870 [Pristionchus pacificus]|eukprot:PDM65150.1 hypothetical protein PRIPAC_53399 [Pristionchus pacificus]
MEDKSRSVSPRSTLVIKGGKRSSSFSLDVKTDSGDHKKVKIEVVDDDKSQVNEDPSEHEKKPEVKVKQEKSTVNPSHRPFYLVRGGPSIWDRADVIPKLTFVNDNDPSAGSDEFTIGIPEKMNDEFIARMDEFSMGKRYKHLHINACLPFVSKKILNQMKRRTETRLKLSNFSVQFRMESSVEYRHLLMQKLGQICAETVTSVNTYMTKDDFPIVVCNKIGFVIQKENHSFYSTGYLRVIKEMLDRSINLMYLETPINCRNVNFHLKDEIIKDSELGPMCKISCLLIARTEHWVYCRNGFKSDGHSGIIINQPLFKLNLKMGQEGFLKVESHL